MSGPSWTPARIELLRQLWAINLSYAAIGRRLGVSAKAIEGARHFYKLPRRTLTGRPRGIRGKTGPHERKCGAYVPTIWSPPVLPPSDIPWPTPQQCMGRK